MKRFLYILIIVSGCKDVYNPTLKNTAINYLVVEGNILAGDDSTIIHLSRTIKISDTARMQPELNAAVTVEGDGGDFYFLPEQNDGVYSAPSLNIGVSEKYRVHIFTADGKEYASDYVPVTQTPPIDSVSWKFDSTGGVNIFVNTHDVTGNTQYYRWEYTETWEHRSVDSSVLIYDNGGLRNRGADEQIYRCWNTTTPGDIFLGSAAGLSSDVIFEKKLVNIPYKSDKIRWVYSILVTQYGLTKEGYEFWDNLKKNTEQLGSIFDPQPFSEFGNIHCISNADEPVVGFISACSATQKRIYIYWAQVHFPYELSGCKMILVSANKIDETFSGNRFVPLSYGNGGTVRAYTVECLDCREQGGTNVKPPYMP
jgi:hypothetical protein